MRKEELPVVYMHVAKIRMKVYKYFADGLGIYQKKATHGVAFNDVVK
jgi:hypothetical protein